MLKGSGAVVFTGGDGHRRRVFAAIDLQKLSAVGVSLVQNHDKRPLQSAQCYKQKSRTPPQYIQKTSLVRRCLQVAPPFRIIVEACCAPRSGCRLTIQQY